MLGTCNTCVRLQSRVTSSGATVDGLFFVCLFVCFYFVCFCFVFVFVFFSFFGGDGGGSINWKEYGSFKGELGIIISAGQSNWEVF